MIKIVAAKSVLDGRWVNVLMDENATYPVKGDTYIIVRESGTIALAYMQYDPEVRNTWPDPVRKKIIAII